MPNHVSNVLWVAPPSSPIQDHVANLQQIGHAVAAVYDLEHWLANPDPIPNVLILSHFPDYKSALNVLLSVKSKTLLNPLLVILHRNELLSLLEKEDFYKSGGNEIIFGEFGPEELEDKLEHYAQLEQQVSDLNHQVDEASNMALLAMETSSDLGSIIGFVKSAINSETYSELARHMLDVTAHYSEHNLIEIKELHQHSYFSSQVSIDENMRAFMREHKNGTRVHLADDTMQINHENLVFLIKGLPCEDPAKMGRITDSLVMLCDISNRFTEALRVEEIVKKTEDSKGRFLTTLSHELRTPLNSMLGFSNLLLKKGGDKPLGDSGLDALNRISDSTHAVNTIVNTLLDIADTESREAHHAEIDLTRLLTRLVPAYQALANKKGLNFHSEIPENVILRSNEKKLAAMLGHLFDNAIKFTDQGTIQFHTQIRHDAEFGDRICFIVNDSGIGIDPVNHKRIFEEIGQLNTEHDRAHYGIGLGLYYVHQISQQLDGEVFVESAIGKGSTFTLCLPIKQVEIDHSKDADSDTTLF